MVEEEGHNACGELIGSESMVLLQGKSGTGKAVVGHFTH
jgi:DNA-binding NtrC family response regulator